MKKLMDTAILIIFCLSFMTPVMPGIAMCLGENGHSEIVNTSNDNCCSAEEHGEKSSIPSLYNDATNECIDIPLSFEAGLKRLSSSRNTVIQSISSYSILDTAAFAHITKIEKLVVAHSPPQDHSTIILSTTIILV